MKVGFIGTGNMGGALAHAAAQSLGSAEAQLLVGADQRGERAGDRLGAVVLHAVQLQRAATERFAVEGALRAGVIGGHESFLSFSRSYDSASRALRGRAVPFRVS